jgi:hypothetical protein
MIDASPLPTIVQCYRCDAAVHQQDAQAMTVAADGTYHLWTPGRVAYYARKSTDVAPALQYLCGSCYRSRFQRRARKNTKHAESLRQPPRSAG